MKTVFAIICTLLAGVAARAAIIETAVAPVRIVWASDTTDKSVLLRPFAGQVSVNNSAEAVTMVSTDSLTASVLLDFGREIYGALKIYTGMSPDQRARRVRVTLGESVTEAMSDLDRPDRALGATNDHSLRQFDTALPWLGSAECGKSGFRFARIDLLDKNTPLALRYVEARSFMPDYEDIGNFECSDSLLNEIWRTGAYTVKLNCQDYVWDGIKRDRLVWLGDLHPEVMTALNVWGAVDVVPKTLDFAADDTPLPGWINGMCSYSLWWLIIQRDWYMHTADRDYLRRSMPYVRELVGQIASQVDSLGHEHLDGTRFLDWPTSENKAVIDLGLHALTAMSLDAAADIARALDDEELGATAASALRRLKSHRLPHLGTKQLAAISTLASLAENQEEAARVILKDGPERFSTFYGYYMLEALAQTGHEREAMQLIKDYWGAMLALGATSFWEEFDIRDAANAGRIDQMPQPGRHDIHADGGAYCYKGLRMSLCHGWASGPTPWMSRHILGVRPLEPGFAKVEIKPFLGGLEYARGTVPTPHGPIKVSISRIPRGPECHVAAPAAITIVPSGPIPIIRE